MRTLRGLVLALVFVVYSIVAVAGNASPPDATNVNAVTVNKVDLNGATNMIGILSLEPMITQETSSYCLGLGTMNTHDVKMPAHILKVRQSDQNITQNQNSVLIDAAVKKSEQIVPTTDDNLAILANKSWMVTDIVSCHLLT